MSHISPFYPSEIACLAGGLEPVGAPHSGADTHCAMCGRPIIHGTPAVPRKVSKTFTNFEWMEETDHICGWCERVIEQTTLRAFQRVVITPKGCYSIGTDANRSWLWLTPPQPPFVVIINSSTTGAFHYLWQTPVTLDKRLIMANFDGVTAPVRTAAIARAVAAAQVLRDTAQAAGYKKIPFSPFVRLARDAYKATPGGHGRLSETALELAAKYPECERAVQDLHELKPGELVALASILKAKPVEPEAPPLRCGQELFSKTATEQEA
ncbi:type IV CRISPR-associated protein Csf1 [Hydrogenophaga bisanensis]|uniref:Type IV CRISPR-associated protein Csf1 n=1 Tax=Hydrogenophaga bisanensis TaxID=439611 RepID=A0ABW2RD58_9BURK